MRQAVEAEAFAVAAAEPDAKRRFLQIAEEWRKLADPANRPSPLPQDDAKDAEAAPGSP